MSRPFFPRNPPSSSSFVRVNGKIRAREVRVIGDEGKQYGVLALGEAILRRRRVLLRYRSWQGEETEREVDPYGMVFHSGRWYVTGQDHRSEALRTFRIDRIHAMLNDLAAKARTAMATTQDADLRARIAAELESPIPRSVASRLVFTSSRA